PVITMLSRLHRFYIFPPAITPLYIAKPLSLARPSLSPYTTLFRSDAADAAPRTALDRRKIRTATPSTIRQFNRSKKASRSGFCRSEEHTSELQSRVELVCRLLLEKKKRSISSSAGNRNIALIELRT